MSTTPFTALTCPLDGDPLQAESNSWVCPSGHRFDCAAQGYVNLLPVQHKRSRDPGDSKEMIAARQRFLAAGHYAPIAELAASATLTDDTTASHPNANALACLDAGCGEGYYLRKLAGRATQENHPLTLLGLDISKWAILAAAKQDGGGKRPATTCWVVGSNAHLPVPPASLQRVLCLFGFPVYPEFARVLQPGGRIIQIDAGPDHLCELREIIYPCVKTSPDQPAKVPSGFELRHQETLRYGITLDDPAQIADLLLMTPHFYRASPAGREKAAQLKKLALTVDVRLQVLEKFSG
ncbi:putative RNA methyltransferase [Azonexus sp.]|uniref:putative RNA methyltransferase n=1 Tax=Azonexus sp. TaxID=1872668 RepID=UPI0027B8F413|nr:methyltransferase domain-containing protein [Azonexus sp.]